MIIVTYPLMVSKKLVPNLLLQVSVIEIHNSMLIPPEEVGLKEAINADNHIIISYSTLRNIIRHQLKNTTSP